jgi:multidrug efflux system outer membrane protein
MHPTNSLAYHLMAVARQQRLWQAVACILSLSLCGCGIPQLCCAKPGAPLPDTYIGVTHAENSAQTGIGEFFSDPVLTRLIVNGLVENQELRIRNQEIEIALNEILARRGMLFPLLSIGARGGFDRTSRFTPLGAAEDQLTYPVGGKFPDPLPNVALTTGLWWQPDIWRQLRNSRDAAIHRYYEAIEQRNFLITRLVAETAENYYELAALDKRLEFLDQTIAIQETSLELAESFKKAGRGTELGVQRFLAEVRKNESQRLIVRQQIIEAENRINFIVGRYPQRVERAAWDYIDLDSRSVRVGVPVDLLQNRRDVRAAEREIAASGLDVAVARANFYPKLIISARVGYEAFSPKYLFDPGAFIAGTAGELVAPLVNRAAIQAEYRTANARQIQAVIEYQQTLLTAFTEVVNSMTKAENYRGSVGIKQQQIKSLEASVSVATDLFQRKHPDVEYMDVLFAQRDLLEARTVLLETKQQQLSAIVRTYQALGGGFLVTDSGMEFSELFCEPPLFPPEESVPQVFPAIETPKTLPGDDFSEMPEEIGPGQEDASQSDEAIPAPDGSLPELEGPKTEN